jgi:hypothetical protein
VTAFLIGAAIGLLAACIIAGYRHIRHIYQTQLARYEPDIPGWVNQGNRAVIGTYDEILAALCEAAHIELWEHELEQVDE